MPQIVHIAGVDPAEEVRLVDEFTHQGAAAHPVSSIDALAQDAEANALIVLPAEPESRLARVAAQAAARGDGVEVVALLASPSFDAACAAFRAGAADVMTSPTGMVAVSSVLKNLSVRRERRLRSLKPLRELERMAITEALAVTRGSVSKSARMLGIGRSTLYRKLDQYGISAK